MVIPSLVSILAAVAVALLSSTWLVALRKRGVPLLSSKSQRGVLFSVTPVQREALFFGEFTEIFEDETTEIRATFDKEGYVIIRGLVNDAMMNRLDAAAQVFLQEENQTKPQTFSALKFNPIYLSPPTNETTNDVSMDAFREVALMSAIPSFIARVLMDLPPNKTLRVLKDVFLAKGREENYCGWHVDDSFFWPACAHSTSELPGVNAWIAMDDIPSKFGGGLAVAPKSHKAEWRQEAYETIGSTQTFPKGGHKNVADLFSNAKTTTCNMAKAAPDLDARIDRTRHVFDFQKGDVLIHTRWIFHRSVPLTKAGAKHFKNVEPVIKRYSIRYEVGDAKLLGGFTLEPSVVLKPENAMKTLDEVSANDTAWYPKCWPQVDANELAHLHEIVEEKLPAFEPLRQVLFREFLPYFRRE
jgi:hypothetical protein